MCTIVHIVYEEAIFWSRTSSVDLSRARYQNLLLFCHEAVSATLLLFEDRVVAPLSYNALLTFCFVFIFLFPCKTTFTFCVTLT